MVATPRIGTTGTGSRPEKPDVIADESAPLSRLKSLHAEAEETARLANLLGRTLYATVSLAAGTAAVFALTQASLAREIAWGVLMLLAIVAVARAYRHAMAAPFERAPLRAFAEDLNAILLYAGFAWGSGAMLVVAPERLVAAFAFSVAMPALLALSLRSARPVLHFVVPAALLGAAGPLLTPSSGSTLAALAVIVAAALIAGAVTLGDRRSLRLRNRTAGLADATAA